MCCVLIYNTFRCYLLNDTHFNKEIFKHKIISWIWLLNPFENCIFVRRIRREIILSTCLVISKYPFSIQNLAKHKVFLGFLNFSIIFFLRILPMVAELFDVYGRTDSHHEPKTSFTEIYVVPDIVHSVSYCMEQSPSRKSNKVSAVKRFPANYGIWKLFNAVTSARHLSLSWAISLTLHPTS
jgi:hypothetical protein